MGNKVFYRLKQFYFGMSASYTAEDKVFAEKYLSPEELHLFVQLPSFEKKHAVVVGQKMLAGAAHNPELDEKKLVKLGLLHDIGKIAEKNSVISKSVLVIIRYCWPGLYNWLADSGCSRRFYIHKHHGEVGAEMLRKIGVSSEFLSIIKKHDPRVEPFGPDDPIELKILQQADSTY